MKVDTFRYALFFSLSILLSGVFSEVAANPQLRANHVLRKTAAILHAAQKQLKTTKNFTGNFAKAVEHQRMAKKLYLKGDYGMAVQHSRRARMLGLMVIRENKGTTKKEWEFTQEENIAPEKDNIKNPTDVQLDADLAKANPGKVYKDENVINASLNDIDVEEIKSSE